MFEGYEYIVETLPLFIFVWYWACGLIVTMTPGEISFLGYESDFFLFKLLFGPLALILILAGYLLGFLILTFPIWAGVIYGIYYLSNNL